MDGCSVEWRNGSFVNQDALHYLAERCPVDTSFLRMGSPATFFIQLFRFSFCLVIVSTILALYNSIRVLDRTILSTATCSLYWVVMTILMAIKSALLCIFIPVSFSNNCTRQSPLNLTGFVVTTVIQCAIVYTLFLAIEHEIYFRSPDHATVDGPRKNHCVALNWRKMSCSKWRVVVMVISMIPLLFLTATEIVYKVNRNSLAPEPLVWIFIAALFLPRLCVVIGAVYLVKFTKGHHQPTRVGKLFLVIGLIFALFEDIPNSVVTVATTKPCLLHVMTVYDLLQVIGVFAVLFFLMFVRSQYLRIEQESKLNLVWDLQKLLNVNGRRDIIKHYK